MSTHSIINTYFGIGTFDDDWYERFRHDTPFDKVNRVTAAFGTIIQDSNNRFTVTINDLPGRARKIVARVKEINPAAEIFLAVGGNGSSSSYGGASSDPQFAANVMTFLEKHGYDGFDIDWEQEIITDKMNSLVTNMHNTFKTKNYKLTMDVWPTPTDRGYDMAVLRQNLDQMNIMSYGPYESLPQCANAYIQAGFPASKLIGNVITSVNYSGGADTLGSNGTIAAKGSYALSSGMAGAGSWRLDNDYCKAENSNYPTYQGALQLWKTMTAVSQTA